MDIILGAEIRCVGLKKPHFLPDWGVGRLLGNGLRDDLHTFQTASKVLSKELEWECKRVAAAFGVKEWKQRRLHKEGEFRFDSVGDHFRTVWWINHVDTILLFLLQRK